MPDLDRDAVREVRVRVFLSEFDIGAVNIDLSVLRDDPLIDRVQFVAGVDEVFSHLKTLGLSGDVPGLVSVHLGQKLGVGRRGTFKEPPAIRALFNGVKISQCRFIIIARHDLCGGGRFDHDIESARIP